MKSQESRNFHRSFPWLAWGLIAVLLGSTHGCGGGGGSPEGGTTPASTASKTKSESEKPRIALIMKSLANEFFKTMAEGARKHQGEHSSEYELIVNALPPLKVVQFLGNHRRCASGKLGQAVVPGLAASAVPRRRIA